MRRVIFHEPHEKGAIAVIVAVLFGFGVMFGAGALSIDVGNINADRRQLQNGADSVALAAAQTCALTGTCPAATDTGLATLANTNAADGFTKIRRVDGQTPAVCGQGGGLTACPSSSIPATGNLQECPPSSLPASTKYVRVYTETENAAGNTILPYSFGAAIAGSGSGANQQACASVAWGPAGSVPAVFPVTFSTCDWQASNAFKAAPPVGAYPGYGATAPNTAWPAAGTEVVLDTAKNSTDCTSWNGHVAPGSFGTVDNIACDATVNNGWVQGNAGNATPCAGSDLVNEVGTVVYIPIFDCFTKTQGSFANCTDGKNHDWFHTIGYAPFYLTGFYFSGTGSDGNDIFPNSADYNKKPCSGSTRCISGWFTTSALTATIDTSGDPSFGSLAVQLTG
jgi:Flp pilus assembly protein TadG